MNSDGRSPKIPVVSPDFPAWVTRLLGVVTVAYAVVLVAATHYPKPGEFLGTNPPSDKLLHFIAYGVLGLFAAATLRGSGHWSLLNAGRLAAGLALAAVIDEVTQPLFSRTAEPLDWVFDCVGIAGGILLVAVVSSAASARGSR